MKQTLISVIIPIFNTARYLEQCLDSVLAQNIEEMEVLCINDGSTDESLEIMRRYESADARVRVINKQNEGYGASCNRGLQEAKGHWISIVEPDDWIEPDMFSDMTAYAARFEEEPDLVKTPYWRIANPDTPEEKKLHCHYYSMVDENRLMTLGECVEIFSHHPSIWSALYRRDFLEQHKIRFKPIPGAGWADNPFMVESLCQAQRIAYLNKPFYCYREETPEKTRNFALKNSMVPLQRWHDMQDAIERLGVDDEHVLRAHTRRGFIYVSSVYIYVDIETNEELREAARAVYARMDRQLVDTDCDILPYDRRLYHELLDLPETRPNTAETIEQLCGRLIAEFDASNKCADNDVCSASENDATPPFDIEPAEGSVILRMYASKPLSSAMSICVARRFGLRLAQFLQGSKHERAAIARSLRKEMCICRTLHVLDTGYLSFHERELLLALFKSKAKFIAVALDQETKWQRVMDCKRNFGWGAALQLLREGE